MMDAAAMLILAIINACVWLYLNATEPCRHEFDFLADMIPRDDEGMIACRCHKCDEIFKAECGLDLPGALVQLRRDGK